MGIIKSDTHIYEAQVDLHTMKHTGKGRHENSKTSHTPMTCLEYLIVGCFRVNIYKKLELEVTRHRRADLDCKLTSLVYVIRENRRNTNQLTGNSACATHEHEYEYYSGEKSVTLRMLDIQICALTSTSTSLATDSLSREG